MTRPRFVDDLCRRQTQFRLAWLLILVTVFAGSFACLRAWSVAAWPNSWVRKATGLQLSQPEPANLVRAGRIEDFQEVKVYPGTETNGYSIVRPPDENLIAFSTACTHDGCTINWLSSQHVYKCPCCGSQFDTGGAPVNGPAKESLRRLGLQVNASSVLVNLSAILQ
jgi:nitrite reductase/ring-hydroxylating ferredoxin subunit